MAITEKLIAIMPGSAHNVTTTARASSICRDQPRDLSSGLAQRCELLLDMHNGSIAR
jgi:hypothetical protein